MFVIPLRFFSSLASSLRRIIISFFRKVAPGGLVLHPAQLHHPGDALAYGGEVRQKASEPALVYVELPATLGLVLDGILGLALGAHEQKRTVVSCYLPDVVVGLLKAADCLLKVDDVDAVALREDIRLHLGIPTTGLVSEVDSALQKLLHTDDCQNNPSCILMVFPPRPSFKPGAPEWGTPRPVRPCV